MLLIRLHLVSVESPAAFSADYIPTSVFGVNDNVIGLERPIPMASVNGLVRGFVFHDAQRTGTL